MADEGYHPEELLELIKKYGEDFLKELDPKLLQRLDPKYLEGIDPELLKIYGIKSAEERMQEEDIKFAENPSQDPKNPLVQNTYNPLAGVLNTNPAASVPTSSPRHHNIYAYHDNSSGSLVAVIEINTSPEGTVGFDEVVSMMDLTSTSSPTASTASLGNLDVHRLTYPANHVITNSPIARHRDIQVRWNSGFTKVFNILIPGTRNSIPQHTSSTSIPSIYNSMATRGCGVEAIDYEWGTLSQDTGNNTANYDIYTYNVTDVIVNSGNRYYNGASIDYQGLFLYIYQVPDSNYTGPGKSMANAQQIASYTAVPNSSVTGEQTFESITAAFPDDTYYTSTINNISSSLASSTVNIYLSVTDLRNKLLSGSIIVPFTHTIVYSENLIDCSADSGPTFYVCDDVGSPDHYTTSGKDCSGNTIPSQYLPGGGSNATFDGSTNCCPNPCTLAVTGSSTAASYNTSNGTITVNMENPPGTGTGAPWSSGSNYTITITHSAGTSLTQSNPPAGGTTTGISCTTNVTSGTEHQVDVSSNTTIATGMQISGTGIPASTFVGSILAGSLGSVTKFELVDSTGSPVNATSAGTSTLQFGAGNIHIFGSLPATSGADNYIITVTDSDGCIKYIYPKISGSLPKPGCTDSNAINYDASAQTMCTPACCVVCTAATGKLSDPGSSYNGELFDVTSITTTTTTDSATSDGTLYASASMVSSAASFLELDGTQDYTMTLYPVSTAGDFTTAGTAVSTSTGLAVNGSNPTKNFTGLDYGHYAVKVQLVDSTAGTQALENCYTIFYGTVKTPVCTDPNATNYNTVIDASLITSDNSLCVYPVVCCQLAAITIQDINTCSPYLTSAVVCAPGSTGVTGQWKHNGVTIAGSGFSLGAVSNSAQTITLPASLVTSTGSYSVHITASYVGSPSCTQSTLIGVNSINVCGCTDPAALNHNPAATISDGSCIFPSWNCVSYTCTDPGDGTGTYNALATCQASCSPPISGCTDPNATNYNSSAVIDDGSCTYSACLDQTAANYEYDCAGTHIPNATIHNASCCVFPCIPGNQIGYTTSNTTGTCTSQNSDGTITASPIISNGAASWTIHYTDINNNVLYTDPTVYFGSVSAAQYTGLSAGTYYVVVTDSLGCVVSLVFSIGNITLGSGCTDPYSTNYAPEAICDDGSCIYCGCMDDTAWNYNPNASCDDGSCEYIKLDTPCLPKDLDKRLSAADNCLTTKGAEYLSKLKTGLDDDCSIMNDWKLILVIYLLNKKGLPCLYNCSDGGTPTLSTTNAGTTCSSTWITGGGRTGINDSALTHTSITSGEGTTITTPSSFFVNGATLTSGDVIKMPSGHIWSLTGPNAGLPGTVVNYAGYNPETAQGAATGNWRFCNDAVGTITITDSTNYLDNFINFVNTFCKDCNIANTTIFRGGGGGGRGDISKSSNILGHSQNGITFNI